MPEIDVSPLFKDRCCSFSEPKPVHNLEIVFEKKFPENRFARMPDYSSIGTAHKSDWFPASTCTPSVEDIIAYKNSIWTQAVGTL